MSTRLIDIYFTHSFVEKLGEAVKKVYPVFDTISFTKTIITNEWGNTALKERMHIIARNLGQFLPDNYGESIPLLLTVEKEFDGFEHLVFSDFVEIFGLENFDISMNALEIFTRSSAEFAIRPFYIKYPQKTLEQMKQWSLHNNDFVRRLASEGSRPRLPWGMALPIFKKDPTPILCILEELKNDPSESVRRSVANNLNDISKDNPQIVIDLAKKWIGKTDKTDALLKHALRGLLKKGNREVLSLFGLYSSDNVLIKNIKIDPTNISIGSHAQLSFCMIVDAYPHKKVRLEYEIGYKKANGKLSFKVFQIQEKVFKKGEYFFEKKLRFENRTTRKHYEGEHTLTTIINGNRVETVKFMLRINIS
ncbi:MAG: DNA alkylation repair protein [Candidatus Roizmanbacteria bacterium]